MVHQPLGLKSCYHRHPIEDHRKITVALILSRYLINVKKLDFDQASATIWEWLEKCQQLKRLEPSRSHYALPIGLVYSTHALTQVAIQKMIEASQRILVVNSKVQGEAREEGWELIQL